METAARGVPPPWGAACPEHCAGWARRLFQDCVCGAGDAASLGLGMASLLLWGVAELPQIATNFRTKSGRGVSLGLLATWVVGDIFNLVGCLLDPATLPTQFYTAVLYTFITVVLLLQTLYYDYLQRWRKCRGRQTAQDAQVGVGGGENGVKHRSPSDPTAPILLPSAMYTTSHRRDVYYTSARSLANSGTPTLESYLCARSDPAGGRRGLLGDGGSSDEEEGSPARRHRRTVAGTGGASSAVSAGAGYGTFLAVSASFPCQTRAIMETHLIMMSSENSLQDNQYGLWMGWIMAAIYMGGRFPQIFLNIKRGSVEGLNPLMFILALSANVTYVGSILARSMEWGRIKANGPWLLDAVVCVLLDLFILLQFTYYKYVHGRRSELDEDFGDYRQVDKASP